MTIRTALIVAMALTGACLGLTGVAIGFVGVVHDTPAYVHAANTCFAIYASLFILSLLTGVFRRVP